LVHEVVKASDCPALAVDDPLKFQGMGVSSEEITALLKS
jgi:hypothetical protein